MKHLYAILTFLVVIFTINAQDYSVSNINDSLRSNCYAILRVNNMDVKINSTSSASFKVSRAITILDKKHEEYAYIRINLSKNSNLSEFSGCTYNAEGKVVTKLKKK